MSANKDIKSNDVLVEQVEYLYDAVHQRVIEVLWTRATQEGWELFMEAYIPRPTVQFPSEPQYVRRFLFLHDEVAARSLYEGLATSMKEEKTAA